MLTYKDRKVILDALLSWYRRRGRRFSFREAPSPFHVLVAEILLRKTRGEQVDPVFRALVEKYPTPRDLAEADEKDLYSLISPLGIRSRVKDLRRVALLIERRFGGRVPSNESDLKSLPGVGEYIARCVLAISYGQKVAPLDTNVSRVISRLIGIDCKVKGRARRQLLEQAYLQMAPEGDLREFHYALVDLASLVCKPVPRCTKCPLNTLCRYAGAQRL